MGSRRRRWTDRRRSGEGAGESACSSRPAVGVGRRSVTAVSGLGEGMLGTTRGASRFFLARREVRSIEGRHGRLPRGAGGAGTSGSGVSGRSGSAGVVTVGRSGTATGGGRGGRGVSGAGDAAGEASAGDGGVGEGAGSSRAGGESAGAAPTGAAGGACGGAPAGDAGRGAIGCRDAGRAAGRPPRSVVRLARGTVNCGARQRLAYLPQLAAIDRDYPLTALELIALGGWREFGAFRSPSTALTCRQSVFWQKVWIEKDSNGSRESTTTP